MLTAADVYIHSQHQHTVNFPEFSRCIIRNRRDSRVDEKNGLKRIFDTSNIRYYFEREYRCKYEKSKKRNQDLLHTWERVVCKRIGQNINRTKRVEMLAHRSKLKRFSVCRWIWATASPQYNMGRDWSSVEVVGIEKNCVEPTWFYQ